MNLKKIITKKSSKHLLVLLFGFSLAGTGYSYSQNNTPEYNYIIAGKPAIAQVTRLQVLIETYGVGNNNKYPANINDLRKLSSQSVGGSDGRVSATTLLDNSVDYSQYEKATAKDSFKNKIIYKPSNLSNDKLSASGYQLYFTNETGNLSKEIYCNGEGCNNKIAADVNDNFSDPDGFTDAKGYKYFAIRSKPNSDKKAESKKIIDRCLEELKKGNKTQQIYHNLIFSYNMTGQDKKAHEAALNFVRDFPNSAEAYHLLSFEFQGEKSIELLEKAVSLNPKDPSYRMDLAATYANAKQYEKALKEYQRIKNENPDEFSDIDEQISKISKILGK